MPSRSPKTAPKERDSSRKTYSFIHQTSPQPLEIAAKNGVIRKEIIAISAKIRRFFLKIFKSKPSPERAKKVECL